VGGIFRTVGRHVPPPAGLRPPGLWGTVGATVAMPSDYLEVIATRR
jgi:hypothetical protein